jgi:NAD(P)-dependent dehydrogenase (short-subunit alcohol dehydrogenase family)
VSIELGVEGAVVLVTGGVSGVGAGITRVFRRAGAQVVTCARTPSETLGFRQCDVREPDQVDGLIDAVVGEYGHLDVVVNNAGGAPFAPAATASPRFHAKVVGLNLLAPLTVSQRANAAMQTQPSGGVIVNVSSVSGGRASPGTSSYAAAKAGLDNLTKTLAVEWAPKVRVVGIAAGLVRTERALPHYGGEAGLAAVAATVPLGRLAEPDEIGNCALFLASPLASYVTGTTLTVHGGGEVPAFLGALGGFS